MEQRDGFLFYRSFYEAIDSLPKKDQLSTYKAVFEYALNGNELDLSGASAAVMMLIKPNLKASRRKAESGKLGGMARGKQQANGKQNASKQQANWKQNASKQEPIKDKGLRIKDEGLGMKDEGGSPHTPATLSTVISAFMDKINPTPSPRSVDELKGYFDVMGSECCLRAMDEALDAGPEKANWSYIRGILRTKQSHGVRCIADWDRLDTERNEKRGKIVDTGGDQGKGQNLDWGLSAVDL